LIGIIRCGISGGGGGGGLEGGGGGGGGPSDGGGGGTGDNFDDDAVGVDGDTCLANHDCEVDAVGDKLAEDLLLSALGPVGGLLADEAVHDVSTPFPFGPDGGRRAFTMLLPLLFACGTCPFTYGGSLVPAYAPVKPVCGREGPLVRLRGPVGGATIGRDAGGNVEVLAPGVDISVDEDVDAV
jgi:hypothetical protein